MRGNQGAFYVVCTPPVHNVYLSVQQWPWAIKVGNQLGNICVCFKTSVAAAALIGDERVEIDLGREWV